MTVNYSTLTTATNFGGNAYHEFATQGDGTDKLLVILPGYGYTFDYPVLYYLRRAALALGYDVLSVQYGFQAAHVDMTSDTMPYVQEDVNAAFAALPARHYRHICVAGKSLGTFLAAQFAESLTAEHISLILLTPIPGAVQLAGERPTLALIGTGDPRYTSDMIRDTPTLAWRVYDNLDHSLEDKNDWRASLTVLPDIIAACADFLDQD